MTPAELSAEVASARSMTLEHPDICTIEESAIVALADALEAAQAQIAELSAGKVVIPEPTNETINSLAACAEKESVVRSTIGWCRRVAQAAPGAVTLPMLTEELVTKHIGPAIAVVGVAQDLQPVVCRQAKREGFRIGFRVALDRLRPASPDSDSVVVIPEPLKEEIQRIHTPNGWADRGYGTVLIHDALAWARQHARIEPAPLQDGEVVVRREELERLRTVSQSFFAKGGAWQLDYTEEFETALNALRTSHPAKGEGARDA